MGHQCDDAVIHVPAAGAALENRRYASVPARLAAFEKAQQQGSKDAARRSDLARAAAWLAD
jgi:hypothetical protein